MAGCKTRVVFSEAQLGAVTEVVQCLLDRALSEWRNGTAEGSARSAIPGQDPDATARNSTVTPGEC